MYTSNLPAVLPDFLCLTSLIQPGGIVEVWHKSCTSFPLWLLVSSLVSSWVSQRVGCILRSVLFTSPLEAAGESLQQLIALSSHFDLLLSQ